MTEPRTPAFGSGGVAFRFAVPLRQGLLALLLLACCRSTPADRRLPQDAYVWQRVWTSALDRSIDRTASLVAGFRVLVAEWSPDGRIIRAGVDWPVLERAGRPVTAVFRIDFQRALPPPEAIVAAIPAGRLLAGVEIDFDCPTRRLPEYRRFLLRLRPLLPWGTRLGITALTDWLRSRELPALTRAVDQFVLQVHATDDPRDGLFDRRRMLVAVRRMSRISATPFLVSLPTYGVRVVFGPDGRPRATEAERSALTGDGGQELSVSPDEMAGAVASLERDPPFRLAGLVWFRVPAEGDRRSWGLLSWLAVLARQPATAIPVLERSSASPTLLRLVNRSALDAVLPDRIPLDPACGADTMMADGAGPYRRQGSFLKTNDGRMLPGYASLLVGWERCQHRSAESGTGLP